MGLDPRWGERSMMHDPALLAGFRPRETDVLITTAPKCGTTWMQQILHQIRSGGDDTFEVIWDVVPWLEAPDSTLTIDEQLARYEALPEPRLFKTHCTAAQTPGLDLARIVLTSRHPCDACVSMHHHKHDMTDAARSIGMPPPPTSMDEHVAQWLAFGSWFRNLRSWWPERNRENLLWLRYEDLVADLPSGVDRIVAFLGLELTPEQRERVLLHASFGWMRANQGRFTKPRADQPSLFKPGGFIREGAVGGHEKALSPAHVAAILERARQDLEPECRSFLGIP